MNVTISQLLDIGIALSGEKDGDRLLERILTAAMDITGCDAGTIYIRDGDALTFRFMFTLSQGTRRGGQYGPINLPPVPLARQNVCACAALDGKLINVPDVQRSATYDFSGPMRYDALTGYRTVSMLVIPMEDDGGRAIGVLQLINALDGDGTVIPFEVGCEPVILSLASQAAICLTNMNYAAQVQTLLDSFVRVMSTAIDARTPYNANHTRNMVRYGQRFLDWLDNAGSDWNLTPLEKREFIMSVWLHDVGKLAIPVEIMDKNTRLGARLERVLERLRIIALLDRLALLEGRIPREEYNERRWALENGRALILRINGPGVLSDVDAAHVLDLARRRYVDELGKTEPWLEPDELESLTIRRGTLTEEERGIMEAHVTMTETMLGEMRFVGAYAHIPTWASLHHEFLNGQGYPRGLTAKDIPRETRLLTILDVFDALTARDRPYRQPTPAENALAILKSMADLGQLDSHILSLFIKSRAWEETT